MVKFLVHKYVSSQIQLPQKVSFLSASPMKSTYYIKILKDPKQRRTYMNLKDSIKSIFESDRHENYFSFTDDHTEYLVDLDQRALEKIKNLAEQFEDQVGLEIREVHEITENEKQLIMMRKRSRDMYYGGRR